MGCWARSARFAFLFLLIMSGITSTASPFVIADADHDSRAVSRKSDIIPAILDCLKQNKEAVLFKREIKCAPYRKGKELLQKHDSTIPFGITLDKECPNGSRDTRNENVSDEASFSARRLPASTINELIKQQSLIGSHGIRIFGAIFCEHIDIVGHELPFSLVIDWSIFKSGVEIRNLHLKADLSFDNSFIFNYLRILRSKIDGSLFGEQAFIEKLSVSNSSVGSISIGESVLYASTQFDDVSIARELSIRGAAVSYFITQFSRIGGLLDVSHSEARCAYHINKSEIGFFVAKRAGFGTVLPYSMQKDRYFDWSREFTVPVQRILSSPEVKKVVSEPESCVNEFARPYRSQFYVFDSVIRYSLCINEFQWLGPRDESPYSANEFIRPDDDTKNYIRTVIAINGNTIGNNLIIDLWSKHSSLQETMHDKVAPDLHKFEAIGVRTGGLVIDFKDSNRKYVTAVDGLEFDRIYNAHATCEYGGSESMAAPIYEARKLSIISDFTEQLELPTVDDVLKWLNLNNSGSSQPFTAFANAFEKAGQDSTRIKVARADQELCGSAARWLSESVMILICPKSAYQRSTIRPSRESGEIASANLQAPSQAAVFADQLGSDGGWSDLRRGFREIMSPLSDFAQLVFRSTLSLLADHGYRPGKVLWWVSLTLIVFWLIFLWPLGVIAYVPRPGSAPERTLSEEEKKELDSAQPKPLGFSFLIDRFIPGYQINRTHYEIYRYFKRVPLSPAPGAHYPRTVRRLFFVDWPVAPIVDKTEEAGIEKWLLVLRLLGLVFAIFLAAAVSALVVK